MRIDGAIALGGDGPKTALCPGCLDAGSRDDASCAHCGTLRHLRGRYWLDAVLGAKGSARTFRASDSANADRPVVVKELALHGAKGWKEVELFERSVKVLRGVADVTPGIPRYVDHFDTSRGGEIRYYLVQEWVPGESLAARLDSGERFDEARARAVALDLLGTLAALHGLSPPVVHRDVKPANIIDRGPGTEIEARPRYVLIDFDLVQDRLRPDGGSTMSLGTAGYAPLEQLMGRALPASDLYGLGATLVALLSREEPAELYDPTLQRIVFRDRVHVGSAFAELLDRLIAPSVDDRYVSAAEVKEALAASPPAALATADAPGEEEGTEPKPKSRPSGASTRIARRSPPASADLDRRSQETGRAIAALVTSAVGALIAAVVVMVILQPAAHVAGMILSVTLIATFMAVRSHIRAILRRHDAAQLPAAEATPRAIAPREGKGAKRGKARLPTRPVVVEVGVGLEGIEIAASTAAEVLEVFGDDCTCYSYDKDDISGPELRADPELATRARVWKISYDYDAAGEYTPSRPANRRRPAAALIDSDTGLVRQLELGVYQSEIVTAEGLAQTSTLDDLIALYGEEHEFEGGGTLDKYRYPERGLEVWVNPETRIVNSFRIFAAAGA